MDAKSETRAAAKERVGLLLRYCDHLYGLIPASEMDLIIAYAHEHSVDDDASLTNLLAPWQKSIIDDTVVLPSIAPLAARKIATGLARLEQIEGDKRFRSLFDLLGTSPTDSTAKQEAARATAALANSRRKFSDPRKSVVSELLTYCKTYVVTDERAPYVTHVVRSELESLCADGVRKGLLGATLTRKLQSHAVKGGLTQAGAAVLSIQLLRNETGGLQTALDAGFAVCQRCGSQRLAVMPCECKGVEPLDAEAAESTWSEVVNQGTALLREVTFKIASGPELDNFIFERLRPPQRTTWRAILDGQNRNEPFELRAGSRYEHPSSDVGISVAWNKEANTVMVSGPSTPFSISLDGLSLNEWSEMEGRGGKILPIRLTLRRSSQDGSKYGPTDGSIFQELIGLLSKPAGETVPYGRWL